MHPNQIAIQDNLICKLLETKLKHLHIDNFERITHGISSNVFKLIGANENLYLRIASSPKENLTAEIKIHRLLITNGITVPRVIAYENFCSEIKRRSYMVISEIKGNTLKDVATPEVETVLYRAGKELAGINLIMLDGFGSTEKYIKKVTGIRGYLNSFKDFILTDFDKHLDILTRNKIIDQKELNSIKSLVENNPNYFNKTSGFLAHGDYTAEHIFVNEGAYSGLIDFGDARVANRLYDLAYFKICNRAFFPYLLKGYSDIIPKDDLWEDEMLRSTILVGTRIISYLIDDSKHTNKGLENNVKVLSFLEEVRKI